MAGGCLGSKSRFVIAGEATRPQLRFPTLRSNASSPLSCARLLKAIPNGKSVSVCDVYDWLLYCPRREIEDVQTPAQITGDKMLRRPITLIPKAPLPSRHEREKSSRNFSERMLMASGETP
jgi:hypothetical protein